METRGAIDKSEEAGKREDDNGFEIQDDKATWVLDSSIDHRGKVPCRAKTGVWKAAILILGLEFSERMSYFGLKSNLILYLTKELGQELKNAAKNVNYWAGVLALMPLLGGFICDSYLGRFNSVIIFSSLYVVGLGMLSLSQYIPGVKPHPFTSSSSISQSRAMKKHEAMFFTSLYVVAVASGMLKPPLQSLGADQFDEDHEKENKQKMSYFNWWGASVSAGLIAGVTIFSYLHDHVSWGVAFLVLTAIMAVGLVVFYSGKRFYRYKKPASSNPLSSLVRVVVAAVAKRRLPYPVNPAVELYEISDRKKLLCHTPSLRCLDKAAIVDTTDEEMAGARRPAADTRNPWRLTTVTEVEQLKQVIRLLPVWLTTITFGVCMSQPITFFVKQASVMDRKLGPHFEIPAASMSTLSALASLTSVTLYDKVLIPFLRRHTSDNVRGGISILRRIGIGMIFASISMAAAAIVEHRRLTMVPTKISVWWLAPQFVMSGIADSFTLIGLQEYFYGQMPDDLKSLGIALYLSDIGVSSFLTSLLITVVDHVTGAIGKSWFGRDINHSRLDYFYSFISILNAIFLCAFVFVATKNVGRRVVNVAS